MIHFIGRAAGLESGGDTFQSMVIGGQPVRSSGPDHMRTIVSWMAVGGRMNE